MRRLGVRTVILAGTATPNCIRTTCYDALSLDYNVVVLEDCCSARTEIIQLVNMEDMKNVGAVLLPAADFAAYGPDTMPDAAKAIRDEIACRGVRRKYFELVKNIDSSSVRRTYSKKE